MLSLWSLDGLNANIKLPLLNQLTVITFFAQILSVFTQFMKELKTNFKIMYAWKLGSMVKEILFIK